MEAVSIDGFFEMFCSKGKLTNKGGGWRRLRSKDGFKF